MVKDKEQYKVRIAIELRNKHVFLKLHCILIIYFNYLFSTKAQ